MTEQTIFMKTVNTLLSLVPLINLWMFPIQFADRLLALWKTKMMCGDVGQNQSDTHDRRTEALSISVSELSATLDIFE